MLSASGPRGIHLLVDYYGLWPVQGEGITEANLQLRDMLGQLVPERDFIALKTDIKLWSVQSEVFDTLHGLFSSQDLLGPSETKMTWLRKIFVGWNSRQVIEFYSMQVFMNVLLVG